MSLHWIKTILGIVVVTTALSALVLAQSFTASISGVVTDSSQAAVPGAKIVATDVNRSLQHTAETDAEGRYVITPLQPGTYTLTAEAKGFNTYSRSAFDLQVQQRATINVVLTVGTVETVVDVQASAPLLNMTNAALGQVVENKFILSLPLIGRAPLQLTYLAPGIVPVNTGTSQVSTNFVSNGTRNSTSDVLLDGMSVTNVEQNSGITHLQYQPSVDVVQEFKIQTNSFSAEFGNTGGTIINVITKSGTNDLHGSLYEFHRNSALNANSWFSNRAGQRIPSFKRNVFGGTIGGPVWLPRLYNGKNRTFFFFDYEGTRQGSATTRLATVPTLRQRAGDFSDIRDANGRLITVYNPFDTYRTADGRTLRRPFPGNIVPREMQSAVAQRVLSFYPLPTSEGDPFTHTNNFFAQGVNRNRGNQMDIKIDHNLSDKHRISSRYSVSWGNSTPANLWGNPADRFTNGNSRSRTQNFVFDFTRVHSAATIITLRYGLMRQSSYSDPQSLGFDQTSLGLPPLFLTSGIKLFPSFSPEGFQAIGTNGWALIGRGDDVNSVSGGISRIVGGHNLKFGGEARFFRLNYLQPGYPQGNFNFNRGISSEDPNRTSSLQGNAIASMLLGWGTGGDYHIDPWSFSASQYYGGFVQDDWKLTRRLTLNLGLRYDFDVPRTERYNRYNWFDFDAPSPIAGRVPPFPNLKGAMRFTDEKTRRPVNGYYRNVQPRVGFAFALNEKTTVRAGYGIYYTLSRATIKGHLGAAFQTNSGPEFSRDGNLTPYASLDNPFPNGLNVPPGRSQGEATFLGLGVGTDSRENRNPQYQQWNLSIQRELPWNALFEVNYTGSKGTHLYFGGGVENRNRLDPIYFGLGRTALNALVDNPFFGVITDPRSRLSQPRVTLNTLLRPFPQYAGGVSGSTPNIGNSIYHSAQFKFEKRFSHGLVFLGHYTISKLIDDSSFSSGNVAWLGGSTSIQNFKNLRGERSVSAMDIPQRLVLTFSYELPVGRGKPLGSGMNRVSNAVLGGWEVNGLLTFSSGYPIIPHLEGGILWDGTQRPNLMGNPCTEGRVVDRLNRYLNPEAFSRPAPDTYGTAPRTLNCRTPGLRNGDFSVFKNFPFAEGKSLQVRVEAFNITNTPTFGPPNAVFGSTGFGRITGYAGGRGPREIQLALKLYF